MFKARLDNPRLFIDSISTIGELIDEGVFKLGKDGISLIAADRAMVAVVDFKISSDAFETYEIDEEKNIGLNITNFLSVLKRVESGDKLSLVLKDSKLEVLIENSSKRKFLLPLLDISQEEIPPVHQLEFSASAEVMPEVLERGIEDAEVVSDSVVIEVSTSSFNMRAEGDISSTELEVSKGEESLLEIKASENVKSRYPLDYLKKMVKAARFADSVKIELGQDYPMRLSFKAGDKLNLSFVLAPRVAEE